MRRLLFSLGCFVTGVAVCGFGGMVAFGFPLGAGLLLIVVYSAVGFALTAPYVLFPPRERDRATMWFLPLNWWLIGQLFRGFNWVGFKVLDLVWRLAFQFRGGWSLRGRVE